MWSLPHVNVYSHFCFFGCLKWMIFVLSGFIHILFSTHHWFSVSNNLSRVSGLSAISTRSSAYTRAFIWHVSKSIPMTSWFNRSIKSLMKTLNNVGERGQPYMYTYMYNQLNHWILPNEPDVLTQPGSSSVNKIRFKMASQFYTHMNGRKSDRWHWMKSNITILKSNMNMI